MTPTTTSTGNTIQDIINVLTGKVKPTAQVETTVNIAFDQDSMLKLALVALAAGTILIFISIGANKLIK